MRALRPRPEDVIGEIEVNIDQKSTTTEAIEDDSAEILLEPGPDGELHLVDHLASGTGETGGASLDDPTEDESSRSSAPLTVVPAFSKELASELFPVYGGRRWSRSPARRHSAPRGWWCNPGPIAAGASRCAAGAPWWGRSVDNDVVLTDIAVSRKHLTIEFDGASYVLNDLGSGNGTVVNNRDEDGAFRLGHGDKLELGNTVLVFECTAAGTAAAGARQVVRRAGRLTSRARIAGRKQAGRHGRARRPAPHRRRRVASRRVRSRRQPPPLPRPGPRSAQMAAQMPPGQGLGRPPGSARAARTARRAAWTARRGPARAAFARGSSSLAPPLPGRPSPSVNPPRPNRASSLPPPRGSRPPPLAPSAPPQARTILTEAAIALANRHMPAPLTGGLLAAPGRTGRVRRGRCAAADGPAAVLSEPAQLQHLAEHGLVAALPVPQRRHGAAHAEQRAPARAHRHPRPGLRRGRRRHRDGAGVRRRRGSGQLEGRPAAASAMPGPSAEATAAPADPAATRAPIRPRRARRSGRSPRLRPRTPPLASPLPPPRSCIIFMVRRS